MNDGRGFRVALHQSSPGVSGKRRRRTMLAIANEYASIFSDGHDSALMVGELMTRHRDRIHFIDDPFDRTKQIPPGLGQRDMPFVAIEELDAQRMFELLDLHGQSRLADVQLLRRPCEIAASGDFKKGLHVPEFGRHDDGC